MVTRSPPVAIYSKLREREKPASLESTGGNEEVGFFFMSDSCLNFLCLCFLMCLAGGLIYALVDIEQGHVCSSHSPVALASSSSSSSRSLFGGVSPANASGASPIPPAAFVLRRFSTVGKSSKQIMAQIKRLREMMQAKKEELADITSPYLQTLARFVALYELRRKDVEDPYYRSLADEKMVSIVLFRCFFYSSFGSVFTIYPSHTSLNFDSFFSFFYV